MSLHHSQWRVRQATTASLVRSLLLTGFVVLAFCIKSIQSSADEGFIFLMVLVSTLSVFLPLAFARKYWSYRKSERFIKIDGKALFIPTAMMGSLNLDFCRIKSIETLYYSKEIRGLLIGMVDGSSHFIEARMFESKALFDDFMRKLMLEIKDDEISHVEKIQRHQKMIICVVMIMAIAYATTAGPGWQTVSNKAIELGALTKASVQFPQCYRIASSFFLHLDIKHLLLNMACLIFIGRNIDAILGKIRFPGILLGSAFSGSMLSLAYSDSEYVIGASGGIMGMLGAYAVICLRYQRCIPGSMSASARALGAAIFIQLVSDLTTQEVDILSHIGGFLFGAVYIFLFVRECQPGRIVVATISERAAATMIGALYFAGLMYFFSLS